MTDSNQNGGVHAPSVTPERITEFYTQLSEMHPALDADPLALGPKRLNSKIAEVRAMMSEVERVFLQVSQDLHWYKREHRRADADFKMQVKEMLANDPEVRAGRNVADREAMAHTKLRAEQQVLDSYAFAMEDLEAVLIIVKTKRADLKDVSSRLRDQLKICQEEIGLGGRWGRAPRPGSTGEISDKSGNSVDLLVDEAIAKMGDDEEEEEAADVTGDVVGDGEEDLAIATDSDSPMTLTPQNPPETSEEALDSLLEGISDQPEQREARILTSSVEKDFDFDKSLEDLFQ